MLRPPELPHSSGPKRERLPEAVFLFGLSGAGKSYCGELLARRLGYESYELDEYLTSAMREAIQEKRSFTDQMRDEYFSIVKEVILRRVQSAKPVIFMQGAYKQRHRSSLKEAVPSLEFVRVSAPEAVIEQRLTARGDWLGPEYAASIAKNFESSSDARELLNDGASDDELVERFISLFREG